MTPEQYWSQDARHQDQKFYTTYCLLGAACNDYAVGIDLRNEKILNWAAAALYYSLPIRVPTPAEGGDGRELPRVAVHS